MKILNLFAGIGGNRKLWGNEHEITAVELNPEIAALYQSLFPNDNIIVADAHQYLLEHFKEFDFIWSSPPCQSHSKTNYYLPPKYPDMSLYQQIIFLRNWFKGKFCIENVDPYYEPLLSPSIIIDRHLFWTNFYLNKPELFLKEKNVSRQNGDRRFGFDLRNIKIKHRKNQILRNLVNPEIGQYILNTAIGIIQQPKYNQPSLFS